MSLKLKRGLLIIAALIAPFILGLLLTYQVISIPFKTGMQETELVDYQEGPRKSAPALAVPLQGEALIPEEFPVNPVPADAVSLQRGEILFAIHCALCHGPGGKGDGPLADYFARTPENLLGDRASAEFDGSIFVAIQSGFGEMPALSENLTVREQWDIINFLRTLETGAQ